METPRRPQSWPRKFAVALRGVRDGARGQSSFCVHLFFAVLAIAATALLRCTPVEWALVAAAVGFVLVAELFNSAVETLFKGFDQPTRDRVYPALDMAAGAVLLAALTAVAVGLAVFGPRLWAMAR